MKEVSAFWNFLRVVVGTGSESTKPRDWLKVAEKQKALPLLYYFISLPVQSWMWESSFGWMSTYTSGVLALFLQVAGGGDSTQGQVDIFSLNRPTPRPVKSLQMGARVRCLEYVPEPTPSEDAETGSHNSTGVGNTICVGVDDGR